MRLTSRPVLALALVALVALAGVFAVNAYQSWQALQATRAGTLRDVGTIRPWMSVRYIARTYGVPEAALESRLGVPTRPRTTLLELARERHVSPREVVADTRQAVIELRAGGQATPVPPPRSSP